MGPARNKLSPMSLQETPETKVSGKSSVDPTPTPSPQETEIKKEDSIEKKSQKRGRDFQQKLSLKQKRQKLFGSPFETTPKRGRSRKKSSSSQEEEDAPSLQPLEKPTLTPSKSDLD